MAIGRLPKNEWARQFYSEVTLDAIRKGQLDSLNPEYTAADWISGKEIRVFAMPGINDNALHCVRDGVESLVDEVGLDIRVNAYQIDDATRNMVNGYVGRNGLDYESLVRALAVEKYRRPEFRGRQHADVLITKEFFDDDKISWGDSRFYTGTILLALPGDRQKNLGYLKNIARHEAGHLLGYHLHHEDIDVPELDNSPSCLMSPSVPSDYICDKCFVGIDSFWKGLENLTGDNYFRE